MTVPVINPVDTQALGQLNQVQQNNQNDLEVGAADIANTAAKYVDEVNDSYNFLNDVMQSSGNVVIDGQQLLAIQNQIEQFDVSAQVVSKATSTLIKDVDGLIRMQ